MVNEPPRSMYTEALMGIYGATLEELALAIFLLREHLEQYGEWLTPQELQARLRRPGA